MRRLSLVLLLSTASPAFAQEAQETPAAPAEPAPQQAAEPAPAPEPAAPPAAEAAPAAEKPARRPRAPKQDAAPASPAQEQAPAAAQVPAPAPAPAPAAQAPTPTAPATAENPDAENREVVRDEARILLGYLLNSDVRSVVGSLAYPFQLEERRFDTPESLLVTWIKQLRQKRTDLITLYDIEVLTYPELEKKYGRPPARLGTVVPRGSGDVYAAVANLSGRAAVILYRNTNDGWRAFAYTD